MCCILCNQLSAGEHTMREDRKTVSHIKILISELGADLADLGAVLLTDLADHSDLPERHVWVHGPSPQHSNRFSKRRIA